MPDQRPPRIDGDERATLMGLLGYQRASLLRKLDGVADERLAWTPVPTGTSLLWLANHMGDAEWTWVARRFAGRRGELGPHEVTGAAAAARYRRATAMTDSIVAATPDLSTSCTADEVSPSVPLRWVLAHLLEETARHAGHADVLRELLDGETGR
jgi:hypothetical protein